MLVYLADLFHNQQISSSTVPVNIGYLAAYCQKVHGDGVEIKLFKEPEALLAAARVQAPDILGLSNYMWNERLNAFAIQRLRMLNPDMLVVMGGPNIRTDKPGIKDFLDTHPDVDHYILYAAEIPFANLVGEALINGVGAAKHADVDGCMHVAGDALLGEAFISSEKNLDYLPSPYTTGILDEFLEAGHTPLFETNRGCPFSCTYCVWGIAALGKIKTFTMERVKEEMDYVSKRYSKTSSWVLADANFGILPRDVELAQLLRDIYDNTEALSGVNIWWSKVVTDKTVKIAKTLGKLCHAYVAFQSLDPEVLTLIKRSNISIEKLVAFKKEVEDYTDGALTDILLGLPGETKQSHMDSYYGALRLGFDKVGGGEVRLLPGSEMDQVESRKEYGLQTKYRISEADIGFYDGDLVYELEEVVRATNWISEEEMLDLRSIRALLYGCLTYPGEYTPLNAVLLDREINILNVMAEVIDSRQKNTELSSVLDELETLAHDEWFATAEDARRFLSVHENADRIINNPPVKLNFWFIARLIQVPKAYKQFQGELKSAILKIDPSFPEIVLDDLLSFCRERNYICSVLDQRDDEIEKTLKLSPDTLQALQTSGYYNDFNHLTDTDLVLKIDSSKARQIREKLAGVEDMNAFHMLGILREFMGVLHMKVV